MNVTLRQLRIFIGVAEQGSMLGAAAALHLTPPAVSMQIKQLQINIGLSLFASHKRRLTLSPAGQHFLVYAKRVVADLKEAENALAHFKGLDRGMLTIGIQRNAEYFAPRLLALFHEDHPGVEVKLRVAQSRLQLIAGMDAGEIDLCIMGRAPTDVPARTQKFSGNPHVFACPPQHPLNGKAVVPVRALEGCRLIVREPSSGTRVAMERFFLHHKCTPQMSMEIRSNEAIKQSIMAGMGLGFLSLHCIGLELRNGLLGLLRVVDTPTLGVWNLVSLQSKILSPAAEAFCSFVMDQGEKHLRAQDAMLLSFASKRKSTVAQNVRRKMRVGVSKRPVRVGRS